MNKRQLIRSIKSISLKCYNAGVPEQAYFNVMSKFLPPDDNQFLEDRLPGLTHASLRSMNGKLNKLYKDSL